MCVVQSCSGFLAFLVVTDCIVIRDACQVPSNAEQQQQVQIQLCQLMSCVK